MIIEGKKNIDDISLLANAEAQIATLEASNQRLREALKELLEREWQDDEGDPRLEAAREQAKQALQQE